MLVVQTLSSPEKLEFCSDNVNKIPSDTLCHMIYILRDFWKNLSNLDIITIECLCLKIMYFFIFIG